ncbi:hypothetical protein Bca101_034956 [Brassica carinata]
MKSSEFPKEFPRIFRGNPKFEIPVTEVPVSYVITLLKKKTVSDKDTRIKYALLALLCAVILPTSHNPRILPQHAEKIKYMDEFILPQHFQYPIVRLKKSMRVTDRQYRWRRHVTDNREAEEIREGDGTDNTGGKDMERHPR